MDFCGERVSYKKSPLKDVIFQLRFPTILRIGANAPEEFQERIMKEYPFYDETIEQLESVELAEGKPISLNRQSKNYQFTSEDGTNKVNLTPTFIALSTVAYTQWEDFIDKIKFITSEFEEVYHPLFYSRIGLRYQNVITRSKLGLSDKSWRALIRPHILGILSEDSENDAQFYLSEAEFKNTDSSFTKNHFELIHVDEEAEISFLIDCDYFFMKKIELEEKLSAAEDLHAHSTTFIRNAITDELHNAMGPEKISK